MMQQYDVTNFHNHIKGSASINLGRATLLNFFNSFLVFSGFSDEALHLQSLPAVQANLSFGVFPAHPEPLLIAEVP